MNKAGVTSVGEDVQRGEDAGSRHQWQVHELLDLPAPEQRPDPFVFAPDLLAVGCGDQSVPARRYRGPTSTARSL